MSVKILKWSSIFLLVALVLVFLFYILLIVPEYAACTGSMFEGEQSTTIWGNTIDCHGESKAFGEAFFQMMSTLLVAMTTVLIILYWIYLKMKKRHETH